MHIHHIAIICSNYEISKKFYTEILGLRILREVYRAERDSYKLDLDRDFQISTEDIVKIDKHIVRIHVIKTQERKITSGFARAEVIKRVYGKPVKFNNFDYDLTKYIVKKTLSE